jgi:DNA-binding HxlR family transcriptional regulator
MSSGLSSFYRILKDKTRSQIILQLNEKGSLSYTSLMNQIGIKSTGKLNYHLKVLEELVTKNSDGLYILTEKGNLAAKLLTEFSEEKSQSQIEAPFPKGTIIISFLSSLVFISALFVLYLTGAIDLSRFILFLITSISGTVLMIFMEKARVKRASWSPKRQMFGAKVSLIFAGVVGGTISGFFVGGLLLAGLIRMGYFYDAYPFMYASTRNFLDLMIFVGDPIIGGILGAVVGYLIYKRSRFSKISYYDPFA